MIRFIEQRASGCQCFNFPWGFLSTWPLKKSNYQFISTFFCFNIQLIDFIKLEKE